MDREIVISMLDETHAQNYRDMRLKSYQNDPFAFSESFDDEVKKDVREFAKELKVIGDPPEWFLLGAYVDGVLVGFVKFKRDVRSKARHKSMIHAMYVDPDYRKYGIGKKLVNEVIDLAKSMRGLEQIHLWVLHSDHSVSAASFYKKCGFISQGPMVKQDLKIGNEYIDAEYMVFYL